MAKTMRAAVLSALGQPLQIQELPVPEPGPGEVLVRIAASGVCHTDISIMDGEWLMKRPSLPLVPGHEATGYVAAVGSGVDSHQEGDRVGVYWLSSVCGDCEYCNHDNDIFCMKQEGCGYTKNGTYADYCVVSADRAVSLPEGPLDMLAPVMCAGVTSYRGLKELNLSEGEWVVVSGVGGTGHLAVQYAKLMGLKVIAIDVMDEKVQQAKELGADLVFNAAKRSPANKIIMQTGGVHGVLATAPSSQAQEQAVRMLRRTGKLVLIGIPKDPLPLNIFDMVIKGLDVKGSLVGTKEDLREALALVSEGKVKPDVDRRPLEDINEIIGAMRESRVKGRVVLQMA